VNSFSITIKDYYYNQVRRKEEGAKIKSEWHLFFSLRVNQVWLWYALAAKQLGKKGNILHGENVHFSSLFFISFPSWHHFLFPSPPLFPQTPPSLHSFLLPLIGWFAALGGFQKWSKKNSFKSARQASLPMYCRNKSTIIFNS